MISSTTLFRPSSHDSSVARNSPVETSRTPIPTRPASVGDGCHQKVVKLCVEHRILDDRAGGEDARDAAFDESLRLLGIFDLVADGSFVALMAISRVTYRSRAWCGTPAIGMRVPACLSSRPVQRDLELGGEDFGVPRRTLHKSRRRASSSRNIGPLRLDVEILPHHGRQVGKGKVCGHGQGSGVSGSGIVTCQRRCTVPDASTIWSWNKPWGSISAGRPCVSALTST